MALNRAIATALRGEPRSPVGPPAVMESHGLPIIDCHQHFIDARRLRYPVFMQRSAGFEALVGDYEALPRVYLPEDYARDV